MVEYGGWEKKRGGVENGKRGWGEKKRENMGLSVLGFLIQARYAFIKSMYNSML